MGFQSLAVPSAETDAHSSCSDKVDGHHLTALTARLCSPKTERAVKKGDDDDKEERLDAMLQRSEGCVIFTGMIKCRNKSFHRAFNGKHSLHTGR